MAIPHESGEQIPGGGATVAFDVLDYLERRDSADPFAVIEFGHGTAPIAFSGAPYIGGRSYVGVETWLHGDKVEFEVTIFPAATESDRASQNITFLEADSPDAAGLKDGAADEVVISNVFGDPYFERKGINNGSRLLKWAAHLVDNNGLIVVRETLTPLTANLSKSLIRNTGLVVLDELKLAPDDNQAWDAAELRYDGGSVPRIPHPKSFYYFLGKSTAELY